MKFEGDRTSTRSGTIVAAGETERVPEPVGAGSGTASRSELRARSRTYVHPLGLTIDRHSRF